MAHPILKISPQEFIERSRFFPVIDVRAPKEFHQGHIPGAISIPLFDDNERAIIGTTYTKSGSDKAILEGLELVGPKLKSFVSRAKELASNDELLVHCWRGGMRSEAMAWLFTFTGIRTSVLQGGYKAYRKYIRASFNEGPQVVLLGGLTGSGKTDILHQLSALGEQVIDLEGLAHHKGSAFGSLGQPVQPTNEQFENDLAAQWLCLDAKKPVWIEDESRSIGKIIIQDEIFLKMATAKVIFIDVPFEKRVDRLTEEYGSFDKNILSTMIEKISKRIGSDFVVKAVNSLQEGDIRNAVSIVLKYYDKAYRYGISKRDSSKIITLSYPEFIKGYTNLY
jgi:tRNA 2-selenouridine synthase